MWVLSLHPLSRSTFTAHRTYVFTNRLWEIGDSVPDSTGVRCTTINTGTSSTMELENVQALEPSKSYAIWQSEGVGSDGEGGEEQGRT